jgi:hypothetical protein
VLRALLEQDLGDHHVAENARQALGVEHREREVTLGVPVLREGARPLRDGLIAYGAKLERTRLAR